MTTLITDDIKYQLFDTLFTKLKESLETDDVEQNEIMEQMILENPSVFISYQLLYHVVNTLEINNNPEININIQLELLDYAWKHLLGNTLLTEFQNYLFGISVQHLK